MSEPAVDENTKSDLPAESADTKESEPTVSVQNGATSNNGKTKELESEPPTKKKRTADRQMTKDDYDQNGSDGEQQEIKHGFQRAAPEVLAKRKIFKVKRPSAAAAATTTTSSSNNSSNPFGGSILSTTTAGKNGIEKKDDAKEQGESKPSNPFAAAMLAPQETPKDGTAASATGEKPAGKKVFGSGSAFSGFKTAIPGTGFGSSTGGFGGFGSAAETSAKGDHKPSSGFGITAAAASSFGKSATTASTGAFGSASASATASTTGNLFQTAAASAGGTKSGFTFGFGKKESNDSDGADDGDGAEAAESSFSGSPAVKLPENVALTTGEEDEEVVHDGRCKSFHWVPKEFETKDTDAEASGAGSATKTNPSVKPSSEFEAAISTEKKDGEGSTDDKKDEGDEDGKVEAKKEEPASPAKKEGCDEKASSTTPSSQPKEFRWQELGVGPMRILRSVSKPDKYRMVHRRESSINGPATKVILNVPLWKESTVERTAPKFLTIRTLVDGHVSQYSLRFKDSSDASYFHHYLSEAFPNAKAAFTGGE
ncbi:MAG: hypothetical protein SGILL_007309 [Bacillariaceae sp.]